LIDDDRSWAQATAELLQNEGYAVLTAEDGEHGLGLIEEVQPALVILDVHLPRLSGLEVLGELRRQSPDLPVIMVSADDQSAVIAQAMSQGASAFLRKPVAAGLLLRALRRLIPSHHAEG